MDYNKIVKLFRNRVKRNNYISYFFISTRDIQKLLTIVNIYLFMIFHGEPLIIRDENCYIILNYVIEILKCRH